MMEYANDEITQSMNDEITQAINYEIMKAYENGYQRGIEENKKNNNKLRNLRMPILADAESKKEKIIAVNKKTFEEIKGKEIMLRFTTELLEEMEKEIKQ